MVGPGWAELAAAMGAASVVLGQDSPQGSLVKDQRPVGDLCPGREHEPFSAGIRARAPGPDFTASMPTLAKSASKDAVKCPADHGPGTESPRCSRLDPSEVAVCCAIHGPSGFAVTKKQYRRCEATAQSAWKKSAVSIVAACARRKFRQVVSARRCGAGGIFSA